jgi:hypothetical protein
MAIRERQVNGYEFHTRRSQVAGRSSIFNDGFGVDHGNEAVTRFNTEISGCNGSALRHGQITDDGRGQAKRCPCFGSNIRQP